MRLLCPFCQKVITVPDSEAGKAVNCPECGQQFAAPQLFTPAAVNEPPPVEHTEFPVPNFAAEQAAPATKVETQSPPRLPEQTARDLAAAGLARHVSVPLDLRYIRFVPPAALFLAFILTFFSWNGLYPGGYAAYTQNAWQSLFATMSKDDVAEDEMKMGEELDKKLRSSLWLLPYLVLLLPTLAIAAAGPVIALLKIVVPKGLEPLMKYRTLILGGLSLLLLLVLLAQWAAGFGLQNSVNRKIEGDFAERKAQANTPEKVQRFEMMVSAVRAAAQVRTTPWLRLVVLLQILTTVAVAAEIGLTVRGDKPPPRVAAMW